MDGKCSDVNECELKLFPCANGAKCVNTAGGYECSCPPGTQGDPEASGCFPVLDKHECTQDAQCSDEAQCVQNICISVCSRPNSCGINALCTTTGHRKQCQCRAGYEGDADLVCHKIVDCVSGSSCPGNLQCIHKKCGCLPGEPRVLDYCIGMYSFILVFIQNDYK